MNTGRLFSELRTSFYIYRWHIFAGVIGTSTLIHLPKSIRCYNSYVKTQTEERDIMVKKGMI